MDFGNLKLQIAEEADSGPLFLPFPEKKLIREMTVQRHRATCLKVIEKPLLCGKCQRVPSQGLEDRSTS